MLHGQELSEAYASADIFVMPSESETLGFVVLEAMASQMPVVAVRAGGIPDIIQSPGITGFLYESGQYTLMHVLAATTSDQLIRILQWPTQRQRVHVDCEFGFSVVASTVHYAFVACCFVQAMLKQRQAT